MEKYDLDEYDEVNPSLKSVDLNASIKDSAVQDVWSGPYVLNGTVFNRGV